MVEKMLISLTLLILCVRSELRIDKRLSIGSTCKENSPFHILNTNVYPWGPTKGEVSEIVINGAFDTDTYVVSQNVAITDSVGYAWYADSAVFNSTYYAGEITEFYTYVTWPTEPGEYEAIFNLMNKESVACWKLVFLLF